MPHARPDSSRIFGAEIQYFRLDPQFWEPMIKLFKTTGLKCVTTYVQWGTHCVGPADETRPAGVFDFTGRTDPRLNLMGFLDLIQKHGLELNFRAGPFCCNEMPYGGYPSWLTLGDPNMMVWDHQNRTTQGYWIGRREGSQPSYLHPKYLELAGLWIDAVDPIIKPRLKANGGSITMINLDNEISYIVQDGMLTSDYNPVNVAPGGHYHRFLTEKYGSAANLPYAKHYAYIDGVQPPRSIPETVGEDVAWYLDWCEFKEWAMCQYIKTLRQRHQANGVKDVTFMTNFNPHLPEGIPTRMPSFESAIQSEESPGIVGYDFYRGVFMSYSGYQSMARVLKLMNATLSYTWSAEFMAGTWLKVVNGRVSDDHMRFMARCALAHGCKAIAWFMFHDRDCWGDSPASSHAHPRPSIEVLKETYDLATRRIADWDALVPLNDACICYDLIQHRHTYLGDPSPCNDNESHLGKPSIHGVEAGKASREYYGLFRLIEESGMQPGVVDLIHSPAKLRNYPIAFLPGSPIIERYASNSLGDYVNEGGTLVVSGAWPTVDEHGKAFHFLGLTRPHATHNAATTFSLGKGKVIWHSGYLAQENPEEESLANLAFVSTTLAASIPEPHVHIEPSTPVSYIDWAPTGGGSKLVNQPRNLGSAIIQQSDKTRILFVLNHYPEAVVFDLRFKSPPKELRNLFTGQVVSVINGKASVDIDRKCGEIFEMV